MAGDGPECLVAVPPELDALLPSVFNHVFAGELSVR
jgi:hypothetical protein